MLDILKDLTKMILIGYIRAMINILNDIITFFSARTITQRMVEGKQRAVNVMDNVYNFTVNNKMLVDTWDRGYHRTYR